MAERKSRKRPRNAGRSNSQLTAPIAAFWDTFQEALAVLHLDVGPVSGNRICIVDAEGREAAIDLGNLFRLISQQNQSEWRALIIEHLDQCGPAAIARVELAVAAGLAANKGRLLPCLKPAAQGDGQGRPWFQPLVHPDEASAALSTALAKSKSLRQAASRVTKAMAEPSESPGLWVLLGIDLPETIVYATEQMVTATRRPASEWLQRAYRNLQKRTAPDWFQVLDKDSGLRWVTTHDSYDAPRALILDRLLPGIADKGWFVAPVGRDNLYFMPATAENANNLVVPLKQMVLEELEKEAYPLSDEVYWAYEGRWYRYPIVMFGGDPVVVPPQEFNRVFGLFDEIEHAGKAGHVIDATKESAAKKRRRK